MFELSYIFKKKEYHVSNGYSIEDLKDTANAVADSLKEIHGCKRITFWISEKDNIIEEFNL